MQGRPCSDQWSRAIRDPTGVTCRRPCTTGSLERHTSWRVVAALRSRPSRSKNTRRPCRLVLSVAIPNERFTERSPDNGRAARCRLAPSLPFVGMLLARGIAAWSARVGARERLNVAEISPGCLVYPYNPPHVCGGPQDRGASNYYMVPKSEAYSGNFEYLHETAEKQPLANHLPGFYAYCIEIHRRSAAGAKKQSLPVDVFASASALENPRLKLGGRRQDVLSSSLP